MRVFGLGLAVAALLAAAGRAEDVPVEVDQAEIGPLLLGRFAARGSGRTVIRLPFKDGSERAFIVERDDYTLSPELQAQFPSIVNYFGAEVGVEDPMTVTVHFSEALGLHAEFRTAADEVITLRPENKFDPSAASSRAAKMVFKDRKDAEPTHLECGTGEEAPRKAESGTDRRRLRTTHADAASHVSRELQTDKLLANCQGEKDLLGNLVCNPSLNNADCAYDAGDCCSIYKRCEDAEDCACIDPEQNTVPHREYRLAITATKTYVDFYNGSAEAIVASYAVIVGRVNRFFMREMSVSFVVIPEVVNLFDRTGRLSDDQDSARRLSPAFIREVLNDDQYDMGHMFGNYRNGLGVIGAVCGSEKAVGGSGVLAFEYGEWVVAHEFGHLFGAHHTYSNCNGNAGEHGVEAGSGESIMSYGGTCGSQDVDADRDTYFHSFSFAEMFACIKNPLTCGACATIKSDPVQQAPVMQTDLDAETTSRETTCRVPVKTPFRLEARRGERSRGLFYSWEQSQLRPSKAANSGIFNEQDNNTILFSSTFPQRDVLARTFPRIDMVRRGMDTVDTRERLPNLARTIPFTMLVRTAYLPEPSNDIRDLGWGEPVPEADGIPVPLLGATFMTEEVVLEVIDEDPLRVVDVTSPVLPGGELRVEWTGAQTTTERVRILLSLDDGETFPVLLAADVANVDGTAVVAVPELPGCGLGFARVRVESLDAQEGCSFFAMNDYTLAVDGCNTTGTMPPPVPDWPLNGPPTRIVRLGAGPGRFDHRNRRGASARLDSYGSHSPSLYLFIGLEGQLAQFTITAFNTEEDSDVVSIASRRKGNLLWRGSGNLEGSLPITVRSTSDGLRLLFSRESSGTRTGGFVVDFESVEADESRQVGPTTSSVAQDDYELRDTLWSTGGSAEVSRAYTALPGESVVVVTPSLFMAEAGNVSFFDGDGSLLHRVTADDDVLAFPVSSKSDTMIVEAGGLAGEKGELSLLVRGLEATFAPTSSPTSPSPSPPSPSPPSPSPPSPSAPSPSPPSPSAPSPSVIAGMDVGVFAGIMAGGAVAVIGAVAVAFVVFRRRKSEAPMLGIQELDEKHPALEQ